MRRIPMYMADWITKLDAFLALNDRDILTHAGRISHDMAQNKAEEQYDAFQAAQTAAPAATCPLLAPLPLWPRCTRTRKGTASPPAC